MAEAPAKKDGITEALAEMLYERSMEWSSEQWVTWEHVSAANRKHWFDIAAGEAERLRQVIRTVRPAETATGWTYEGIARRATEDTAFQSGLRAAAAVCRAQGTSIPCPSDMAAVYIERLSNGEQP